MPRCEYCNDPKPVEPMGCCIVGEAWAAFSRWEDEWARTHDPHGEIGVIERIEAYGRALEGK